MTLVGSRRCVDEEGGVNSCSETATDANLDRFIEACQYNGLFAMVPKMLVVMESDGVQRGFKGTTCWCGEALSLFVVPVLTNACHCNAQNGSTS